jgi:hypothetical protein
VQLEALQQQLAVQMDGTVQAKAVQVKAVQDPPGAARPDASTGALVAQLAAFGQAAAAAAAAAGPLLRPQVLTPPQQVSLTLQESLALQAHQHLVTAWGWKVHIPAPTSAPAAAAAGDAAAGSLMMGTCQVVLLQQVPVLAGVALGAVDLQVSEPGSSAGARSLRPSCVLVHAAAISLHAHELVLHDSRNTNSACLMHPKGAELCTAPGHTNINMRTDASSLLQLYLHQLLEASGSSSQPPPGVLRVLRSKACRSAIMFGDTLSRQQCGELLTQLSGTQLCFMCAHGR